MSEKNLLSESQIRQFMKLAQIDPLTPGFVEGLTESTTTELEESHGRRPNEGAGGPPDQNSRNEGMGMYRDDEDDLENAEDDMDHADDLEMDAEEDLGDIDAAEVGDDSMISVSVFLKALETALEKASGEEVEIDADLDDDGMDVDGMDPTPRPWKSIQTWKWATKMSMST